VVDREVTGEYERYAQQPMQPIYRPKGYGRPTFMDPCLYLCSFWPHLWGHKRISHQSKTHPHVKTRCIMAKYVVGNDARCTNTNAHPIHSPLEKGRLTRSVRPSCSRLSSCGGHLRWVPCTDGGGCPQDGNGVTGDRPILDDKADRCSHKSTWAEGE
jgi:hypothetical protein